MIKSVLLQIQVWITVDKQNTSFMRHQSEEIQNLLLNLNFNMENVKL